VQCATFIDSDLPGVAAKKPGAKAVRALCQRLKGKQGRFRGNLSGKRVDFTGRTVISPDPNLGIHEVAVPELVAKTLTYPERVTSYNIERMKQLVLAGANNHPGANNIETPGGGKWSLRGVSAAMLRERAANLRIGDIVERHLEDGDVVLFNRQPSLHRLSIMVRRPRTPLPLPLTLTLTLAARPSPTRRTKRE